MTKIVLRLGALFLLAIGASAIPAGAQTDCPPYEVIGEGPDVVLIPGLASPPAVWDATAERLSADHRVHLVHVAGFAGRAAEGEPETVIDRAEAEIVRHLDCTGTKQAAIIGHSMGGVLGLLMARDHGERVSRVMIVDSVPFFPLLFNPAATVEMVRPQADAVRAQIIGQDDAAFEASQRQTILSLVQGDADRERVLQWSLATDRATMAAAVHDLMTRDLRPDLAAITVPVTILYAHNAYATEARMKPIFESAYAGLPDKRLIGMADSFHFIMYDRAEAFAAEVDAFLEP